MITSGPHANLISKQLGWGGTKAIINSMWGELSEVELESFRGSLEHLTGHVRRVYGLTKSQAEQEFNDFTSRLAHACSEPEKASSGTPASGTFFVRPNSRSFR